MERGFKLPRSPVFWTAWIVLALLSHVVATLWFAAPHPNGGLARFHASLPMNKPRVLDPLTPETQPIPFLMPQSFYAVCAYDLAANPLRVSVQLDGIGWALSLHDIDGNGYYFAPGSDDDRLALTLDIIAQDKRLNGLELAGRPNDIKVPKVIAPEHRGFVVVRAPLKGLAYRNRVITKLSDVRCRSVGLRRPPTTARLKPARSSAAPSRMAPSRMVRSSTARPE